MTNQQIPSVGKQERSEGNKERKHKEQITGAKKGLKSKHKQHMWKDGYGQITCVEGGILRILREGEVQLKLCHAIFQESPHPRASCKGANA